MSKTMVIAGPVATRSGYGDMARGLAHHFIEWAKTKDMEVLIHSLPWGETPMNALDENNPNDKIISDRIMTENLNKQPDIFVHVGVPNEAQPHGKYNILCTAGIETTAASSKWIVGCNRMDLVLTISEHSKQVFEYSKYTAEHMGKEVTIQLEKPIEVLHNYIDVNVFGKKAPTDVDLTKLLDEEIPEKFCFLFVGHWLRGDYGEDRKNVSMLIKLFLETFKQVETKHGTPALILKTSSAGFSIMDREKILDKIDKIKKSVELEPGQVMPNVYLLHGELTEKEMNTLYNHPKVKVHVSLTKGEGFGRPLLEATLSGKPVLASGWSGQLEFLDKERALLIGGELKKVHDSSVWEDVILKESSWFSPDVSQVMNGMAAAVLEYDQYKEGAYQLMLDNRKKFSYDKIKEDTFRLLDKYVPDFPEEIELKLPKLKRVE